ncbi:MAG: hypothetical protein C0504_16920 [Candidatus Solibacter sp.]|nr:hypothetical protein [Candidatus Solibacter sp.]
MNERAIELARVIWAYHQLGQEAERAEWMVVFGTNDTRVAEYAAEMYGRGYAERMVITGGMAHGGDLLATGWTRPEAEVFADVAAERGAPREKMLLEPRAMNTAENIRFTRALLEERGERPEKVLLVMKPFMQRRVWATMAVEWAGMGATVTSPTMTLEEYFTPELPAERIIPIMMGDLQRIWVYGRRGWSAVQRVPGEVLEAYRELVKMGFTQHLLEGEAEPDGE